MAEEDRIDWKQVLNDRPLPEVHDFGEATQGVSDSAMENQRQVQDEYTRIDFERGRSSESRDSSLPRRRNAWWGLGHMLASCIDMLVYPAIFAYSFLWLIILMWVVGLIGLAQTGKVILFVILWSAIFLPGLGLIFYATVLIHEHYD